MNQWKNQNSFFKSFNWLIVLYPFELHSSLSAQSEIWNKMIFNNIEHFKLIRVMLIPKLYFHKLTCIWSHWITFIVIPVIQLCVAFRVTITIIPTIHFHELIRYKFTGPLSVVLAQSLTFRDSFSVSWELFAASNPLAIPLAHKAPLFFIMDSHG